MAERKKPEQENTADLEAVKKEIAAMLAAAKEEAAQIVADAQEKAGRKGGMSAQELAEHRAQMDELVEVKLFKDNGKYKDDVFVGVNGESIAIKRGERVKIKRKFAELLDNSDKQDYETSLLIERKSGEFARSGL